jgi:hypothetical protein
MIMAIGLPTMFDRPTTTTSAYHQSADVYRMEAVHILVGIYSGKHLLFIDMFGEWKLNKDAVYLRILVILVHKFEQILFRYILGLVILNRMEPQVMGGLLFTGNVADRRGVFAYQYGDQSGDDTIVFFHFCDFLLQLFPDLGRYLRSAYNLCRHNSSFIINLSFLSVQAVPVASTPLS